MMKWPKISIVTPSYNQGQFIEQTIKSILDQNYPNLEYIIQDSKSTDATLSILKKYHRHLKYESKKDKGQTHAINLGFKKSTGEILAYLNADDLLLPGTLRKIGIAFSQNPKILWATGQCQIIDEHGRPIRGFVKNYKDFWLKNYSYSTLLILNYICQPATFWRSLAWQKVGVFDETLQLAMDYEYWLRLGQLSKPLIFNQPLAAFRMHSSSKTMQGFKKQIAEEYRQLTKFTSNPAIKTLHRFHSSAVKLVYSSIQ